LAENYAGFTKDQNLRFLVDDALFSDAVSVRVRAINQLARDYGVMAIPVIEDIIKILPVTEDVFRTFCANVLNDLKEEQAIEANIGKR